MNHGFAFAGDNVTPSTFSRVMTPQREPKYAVKLVHSWLKKHKFTNLFVWDQEMFGRHYDIIQISPYGINAIIEELVVTIGAEFNTLTYRYEGGKRFDLADPKCDPKDIVKEVRRLAKES